MTICANCEEPKAEIDGNTVICNDCAGKQSWEIGAGPPCPDCESTGPEHIGHCPRGCSRSVKRRGTPDSGPGGGIDLRSYRTCNKDAVAVFERVLHNPEANNPPFRVCADCKKAIGWRHSEYRLVEMI